MNRINPDKLKLSKWTSRNPQNKEKHWLVTDIEKDESGVVINCELQAVINKRTIGIDWRELKQSELWLQGWK